MCSNTGISRERDEIKKTNLKWVSYQIQFQNYNFCKEKHTKISLLNYI